MQPKSNIASLALPLFSLIAHASAGCQAEPGTCGAAVDTWIPFISSGFQRSVAIYDGQCNEIARDDIGIERYAALTSKLPLTVNFDTTCGFEPCGTVKYGGQTEILPGNCEDGCDWSINACKRCWVYFDDAAC